MIRGYRTWVLCGILVTACWLARGTASEERMPPDVRRDLQIESQRLLSRGLYEKAIDAADHLIHHPTQDAVLLIWGLRIKVFAFGLLGNTDAAVRTVHEVIEEREDDGRIYTGSYEYPVSLTVKRDGYSYLVAVHRINEDFPRAIRACEDLQATWRECIKWAHEEHDIRRQYQPFVQCEMMLADLHRLNGDRDAAAQHYRKATQYVRGHPWPREEQPTGAGSMDDHVLAAATSLLEQCERWSADQIAFVRNVDYKIELAGVHEDAAGKYNNLPQWRRAQELYVQAREYLAAHERPAGVFDDAHYKELSESTLPKAIERCTRHIWRISPEPTRQQ